MIRDITAVRFKDYVSTFLVAMAAAGDMNCRRLRPTLETTFDFRHLNRRNGCFVSARLVSGDKESFVPSLPTLSLPINSLCNIRRETLDVGAESGNRASRYHSWKSFELEFLDIIKIDRHRYCNGTARWKGSLSKNYPNFCFYRCVICTIQLCYFRLKNYSNFIIITWYFFYNFKFKINVYRIRVYNWK